ncbi:DNA-directed RNA polymerase sigma-70 factor [Kineosporia sp. NBRC 101677]|nr:DNA-directed RNA polymerase sigma-70 factor [Kineosporia sp. NBRC 101677]
MVIVDERLGLGPAADADLLASIRAGNQEAFTELFERYAQTVWNYAYRLTASWAEAEDIAGAVYLVLWRRRHEVRIVNGSALPWLLKVTNTLVRNERRRLARYLRALPRIASHQADRDHAEELSEQAAARARLERVLHAVRRLPRAEREAVEYCALGRMATGDVAELLGITEASVRSRLSRARARLHTMTDLNDED